ncbi:MAG TPA: Ig-like domain-containing protein [Longimicrobiales bacterium]|nr:Ig-like domain-containing protein [Longimicrobiales bacterium]
MLSNVYKLFVVAAAVSACGDASGPKIGPPAALTVTGGNSQTGEVGLALPANVAVKVADANGNGVPNTAVTWAAAGGGVITAVSTMTDNSGIAEAKWTLGVLAGAQTATATAAGVSAATITATARAGAASQVSKDAGDAQTATVATTTAAQPTLKVADKYGNVVSGATVTWSTAGGASVTSASSVSDAQGLARTTWQMGTIAGAYRLTGSITGASAEFTATAQAGATATVTVTPNVNVKDWGQTLQFAATAADAYGNAVTRTPTWASSNNNIATINASGLATTLRAGTTAISATMDGRIGTANLSVTAVSMKISVNNTLRLGITVKVNGGTIGTVPLQSTREFTINTPSALTLSWDIIRQVRTDGVSIGDNFGGVFDPFAPTFFEAFEVDHTIGNETYFGPYVDNNSTADWLMVVNWGLQYENRCNCTAPRNTKSIFLGYYRWVPATTIRAYRTGSNYTGNYLYWQDFQQLVEQFGALTIFSDLVPNLISQPETLGRNRGVPSPSSTRRGRSDHPNVYPKEIAPRTTAPIAITK